MDKKKKIEAISISVKSSILEALKQMDETYKRLLLVFNNDKFINVLSIGDIQRAIIKNVDLTFPIKDILRSNPRFSYQEEPSSIIKNRMLEYRTECMPVLNEKNELVDVLFWEDIFPAKEIQKQIINLPVVIMAGGKGTRLKPITNIIPKALIPIGEKTILEEIMDRFLKYNCNEFYISVNYKAETIKHYFSQLTNSQYKIHYFQEDKPLGTAGSLSLIKDKIQTTFFVSNCDIIINDDYSEILKYHQENKNELTIVATLKHYPIPYGTIETEQNGNLKSLIEKPELTFKINSGMYILEPHLLNEIPENKFFHITELIENIKNRNGSVGVFPVSEGSWQDVGTWSEYFKTLK
ncbi:nucleotidyltransferase family protein [Bacteroidota bacterium]